MPPTVKMISNGLFLSFNKKLSTKKETATAVISQKTQLKQRTPPKHMNIVIKLKLQKPSFHPIKTKTNSRQVFAALNF